MPAYRGGDWRAWLGELCRAVHRMSDSCGPGFWELATRRDLPPGLSAIEEERRRGRREAMATLAATLWSAASRPGRPPQVVKTAVAVHLSPHFTAAVKDAGYDWPRAARLALSAIETTMRHELGDSLSG